MLPYVVSQPSTKRRSINRTWNSIYQQNTMLLLLNIYLHTLLWKYSNPNLNSPPQISSWNTYFEVLQTWAAQFGIHNVEISGFFCYSECMWHQFWSFWSPKNCHFDHMSSSEFSSFGYFWHFQVWNSQKNQNSKPPK